MFPHMYKVRHRNSTDRNSDDSKPEWQTDTWRRNSNRWPASPDGSSPGGGETPPTGAETPPTGAKTPPTGAQTPPSRGGPHHQQQPSLQQSASTSTMPHCPPPIPAPPLDPQDDLSKNNHPEDEQRPATPNMNSTPRTRRRQVQVESSKGLTVPDGGRGPRSRFSKWRGKLQQWVGSKDETSKPRENYNGKSSTDLPCTGQTNSGTSRSGQSTNGLTSKGTSNPEKSSNRRIGVEPTRNNSNPGTEETSHGQSSSPYEVWGTPDEQWGPESNDIGRSPSPASGRLVRQRQMDSSGSEMFHTEQDGSQATDAEASEVGNQGVSDAAGSSPALPNDNTELLDSNNTLTNSSRNDLTTDTTTTTACDVTVDNDSLTKTNNIDSEINCEDEETDVDGRPGELSNEPENTSILLSSLIPSEFGDNTEELNNNLQLKMPACIGDDNINEDEHNSTSVDTVVTSSPEVADEWKNLLVDALGDHNNDDGDDEDDNFDEFDFDSGKNAFYQAEGPAELYQCPTISYMPSSKQEFLRNQQKEDEQYIMAALDEERDVLLKPFMEEKEPIEETDQIETSPSLDNGNNKTDTLNVSDNEDDARAWSPGSPIFKRDLERHRMASQEDDDEIEHETSNEQEEEEEKPWWEDDRPTSSEGGVPAAPPPPAAPPLPFPSKVNPSSTMSKIRQAQLDNIKKAARTRPDWHALMKNLEEGTKLKHVTERNDRSKPVLPGSRGKNGKFVYDSEKPMVVNELLHEIQRGVKLRRTRTDDRSKPDFAKLGMRKIRRQLTIEEKKKVKPEDPEALPSSSDDDEDIDNMRDDLTATRTQLADELKKTKKLEREKKVMRIDIEALNAEIKKLKRQLKEAGITDKSLMNGEGSILPKLEKSMSKLRMSDKEDMDYDELDNIEGEIKELDGQIDVQRKRAEGLDGKVYELEQKLKVSDANGDEWEGRAIFFEKKYKALQRDQNIELPDIGMMSTQTDPIEFSTPDTINEPMPFDGFGSAARKSGSRRSFASQFNRMESFQEEMDEDTSSSSSEESEEEEEEEEEEGEDHTIAEDNDEDDEAKEAKRVENETKRLNRDRELWQTKLDNMKGKEANVIKERNNLRERINKYYGDMYKERVDYLKSKSELDELVGQLKDPESEVEEEEDEEEEEEEEQHGDDEPGWWFDQPNLKPKKLKQKKRLNADGEEEEEEEEEEDLEDLTQLEAPCYSDTEEEESEPEDENDSMQVRINFLQMRAKNHEQRMNIIKKNNYLLKTDVECCKERYNEERLRRKRLDEELNMLVSDMQ